MMRVQIISAKGKASHTGPNSSEIHKKKMTAMQEHFEKQIQELVIKNQFSVKPESLTNNAGTPESAGKKKNVSFALTES
jgi:predicted outer membrane protein